MVIIKLVLLITTAGYLFNECSATCLTTSTANFYFTESDASATKPDNHKNKTIEETIKDLILKIDTNKNGFIGKDELRKYFKDTDILPWYVKIDTAVEKIFEELDFDPKDGQISEKEMLERKKIIEDNLKYLQKN
jgi:hypothetical protein